MDGMNAKRRRLLLRLYFHSMSDESFDKAVGWVDHSQPNETEIFFRRNHLVRIEKRGEPDGEGGWIDDTVTRHYFIRPEGEAFIEDYYWNPLCKFLRGFLGPILGVLLGKP